MDRQKLARLYSRFCQDILDYEKEVAMFSPDIKEKLIDVREKLMDIDDDVNDLPY